MASALLAESGLYFTDQSKLQLDLYVRLIRDWNSFASLVSRQDLELLEKTHIPDSLSLAPVIQQLGKTSAHLLDIGTGGGLPAIPLKVLLPDLRVEMVERNAKKAGFLDKVIGALGLQGITVVQGNFPQVKITPPDLVTARALEKPAKLIPHILAVLPLGGIYLCQTTTAQADVRFHVERVHDQWSCSGLRRGELYIIRRITP